MRWYADYWSRSTGLRCSPAIEEELIDLLTQGVTYPDVIYAIDQTTMAPRPSWAYCRAILRRLANQR